MPATRTRLVRVWLLLVLSTALCPQPAHARQSDIAGDDPIAADRPGIADNSAVVGAGRLQIETGYQFDRDADAGSHSSSIPTLLRAGLGNRWEVRVESNVFMWTSPTPPADDGDGWASTSAGVKYRWLDEGAWRRTSMALIARVAPPSGSAAFGTTRLTADVRAVADLQLSDRFALNPNAGIARDEGDDGSPFTAALFAVTLGYAHSEQFNPFVDVAWQSAVDAGGPGAWVVDAGFGWIVAPDVQIDVSAGRAVHGPGPVPFVSAGVSVRVGGRR